MQRPRTVRDQHRTFEDGQVGQHHGTAGPPGGEIGRPQRIPCAVLFGSDGTAPHHPHHHAVGQQLGARLRTRLFARLALQAPGYFQQQRTGDLMALATHNIPQDQADEIFDLMEKFAGYGFNKSHAAAYSLLPVAVMIGYLAIARRMGAFESL